MGVSLVVATAAALPAQQGYHLSVRRPATTAEVIGGNALVGGLTAAAQAMLRGNDPFRAFGIGVLGGAVYLFGKNLAVEPGAAKAWMGLALAGTGTSIVANAGRGVGPFQEMTIPIAAARVRIVPRDSHKVRLTVNAYESGLFVRALLRSGIDIEWGRSAASGTGVFLTRERRIIVDDSEVSGVATGPVVTISAFAFDASRVLRHELVHAHQHWFAAETWGRPIEDVLRSKIPGARRLPAWMDVGIVAPALIGLEQWLTNGTGARRLLQAEADLLERR